MTPDALQSAVIASILAEPAYAQFDPLTLLILGAIVSAVIAHYVEKCLDHIDPEVLRAPSWAERQRLRVRVAFACRAAARTQAARQFHLGSLALYNRFGGLVQEHFLKVACRVGEKGQAVRLSAV